jgi:hypothetical protein
MIKGMKANSSGYFLTANGDSPPNTSMPSTINESNSSKASVTRAGFQRVWGSMDHRMSTGARIKPPAISPSHQVTQTGT